MTCIAKKKFFIIVIAILAVFGVFAESPVIVISKQAGVGKTSVSLADLKCSGDTANLFRGVLQNDLNRSGWFTAGNGKYDVFRVSGTASGNSDSLSTSIRVEWPEGGMSWNEVTRGTGNARWQAHRLADEIVFRSKGCKGMSASRIAFLGKTARGSDIFLCDSDGASIVRLSQINVPMLSPYFSPDGNFIYFTGFLRDYASVYRVPVSGGKIDALARFTGLNAGGAVSPDSSLIAVILSNPGNPELFVINIATRKATRQTYTPRGAEASPCWSPDGNHIAYVSDETGRPNIHVISADTKQSKRISFTGIENVAPSWGADGRIAYCTKQNGYQIAVYDPASGEVEVITAGPDHEDPSWAPDGRHIICSRNEGNGVSSLYVIDACSDKSMRDAPIRLPLRAGNWRSPDWSRLLNR